MKVVLSTLGKFHYFALGRQLEQRKVLAEIFTGYPNFKLKNEGLTQDKIHSFPWFRILHVLSFKFNQPWLIRETEWWNLHYYDTYVANNLPECDVVCAVSGGGLNTGKKAKSRGAVYICDRISTHIRYQDTILQEEYELQGKTFEGIAPRVIEREEAEYELADAIVLPSSFAKRSFIEMGVPEKKLCLMPLGVELNKFYPVEQPDKDFFDVLYVGNVSFRKGITYLLQAFSHLQHPHKRLTIVGTIQPELNSIIEQAASEQNITIAGHIPHSELKKIMSRSHVMVLPSIEDGFGYVQAEAMACGCPVIATTNTGAADLFTNEVEGFIVPIRNADAIAQKMQLLADNPDLQKQFSIASIERVKKIGGWNSYGDAMFDLLSRMK